MDLFTLSAKLTLDSSEFDRDIGSAEQKGSSLGEKLSGVGSVVSKGFQVAGAAATAAITAVSGLAKSAIDAYAQYDQLTGGVKTLFDTSADTVIGYAQKAYLTAGVSMNSYLEQVTSFAATLNKSTKNNYQESAEIANRAMISMSDNANKLGTDMGSIQNAYQGFAKGNYTMLDNLKLGYSGTTSEMKRLVKEASKMTEEQGKLGVKIQANSLDFANVVNAIAVVQEHLGIAGTTETEALTTISGSIGLLQASWENLKTTIVDPNGDISGAIDALIFSAKTAMTNLIPAIKQALTGMGTAIAEIAPVIASELPSLISEVLPSMITAATSLLDGFIDAITSSAPTIIAGAVTIITQLATALVDNIDKVVDAAGQIMDAIIQVFQESDSPVLQFIGDSLEKIKSVVDFVIQLFKDFPGAVETLKSSDQPVLQLIGAALELVKGALDWIVAHQTEVIEAVGLILAAFAVGKIASFVAALSPVTLILAGIAALATVIITNWSGIQKFFEDLWAAVKTAVSDAWEAFSKWIGNISESISAAWRTVADWFEANVWSKIKSFFESAWSTISKLWTGITGFIIGAWFNVSSWFDTNVISPVKKFFEDLFGTISKIWTDISTSISDAWGKVYDALSPIIEPIKTLFQGVVDTVQNIWNVLSDIFGLGDKTINITTVHKNIVKTYREDGATITEYDDGSTTFEDDEGGGGATHPFAKGEWNVPYNNYPALLHRGERVLTASQARQMDDGTNGTSLDGLVTAVVQAIREGMQGVQVNSYLDGRELTDAVNRYQGEDLTAGRFA